MGTWRGRGRQLQFGMWHVLTGMRVRHRIVCISSHRCVVLSRLVCLVVHMMRMDVFPRFQASKDGRAFLATLPHRKASTPQVQVQVQPEAKRKS